MTDCLVEAYFDQIATFLYPDIEELLAYSFWVLVLTICFSVVAVREEIFLSQRMNFRKHIFSSITILKSQCDYKEQKMPT